MLGFKSRKAKRKEEFIERSVKKYPKILFWVFFVYFLLFASYMIWYFYFINTYTLCKVEGTSMQNTLNPDITSTTDCEDWFYLNNGQTPELYDIIVIVDTQINSDGKKEPISLVKRVIALEGDLITIKKDTSDSGDGYFHVYVQRAGETDVEMLVEDYVKSYEEWTRYRTSPLESNTHVDYSDGHTVEYEKRFYDNFIDGNEENIIKIGDTWFYRVPEDGVFYMGDNRAYSSDSRIRGIGYLSDVQGVAEVILKNAENANDSQRLGIKFVSICGFYWDKVEEAFAR